MDTFEYPGKPGPLHGETTRKLIQGAFIGYGSEFYDFLSEHFSWYREFFQSSFGIELQKEGEVFYCVNTDSSSGVAQRLLAILAVVLYEIGKDGRDPVSALRSGVFTIQEINTLLDRSIQFPNIGAKYRMDSGFLNKLETLGIVRRSEGKEGAFLFTSAVDIFFRKYERIMEEFSERVHTDP